jgi:hypothetical protein
VRTIALILTLIACIAATQPASAPVTAPTSRATTRPNPLADPTAAVTRLVELIQQENFDEARGLSLHSMTATEVRKAYAAMVTGMHNGGRIEIIETHRADPVAMVLCRWVSPKKVNIFGMIAVQRYDDWKVQVGPLNKRRLTEGESNAMLKLDEIIAPRVKELQAAAATQPLK